LGASSFWEKPALGIRDQGKAALFEKTRKVTVGESKKGRTEKTGCCAFLFSAMIMGKELLDFAGMGQISPSASGVREFSPKPFLPFEEQNLGAEICKG
jgi:hypothetical protein